MFKTHLLTLAAAAAFALGGAGAAGAQITNVDPNSAAESQPAPSGEWAPVDAGDTGETGDSATATTTTATPETYDSQSGSASQRASAASRGDTVPRKDVFTAAEGVFGKGAEGLADMIEKLLKDQGEPSAYITGREAGGAFVAGVRYGSGTLHHQVEGDRPIFWTGPSIGFDFGADASKVFVLVYNLHDGERIFRRYPAAEGNAYVVGGFTASYLRRGDVVLIPVRLGVGARLGVNAGYMRFSQKNRWLPF
ncbi:DUF1134 domain-containing protein [Sphingosinicella sp. BN140058]|uniref:DUF1134 domain-containing protein n=1 Tax=Sphingosinicella sp. BN140058 TaxID=1892855 RepID=UPI001012E3C7|nr:DUF1134 domain-containing protein [Sphingosinicella sp. BN140058]QAY77168.1 DUF1134 domain-containing protein [Sphingosinicella sp. BN140058]